jgi:hypothetical protein
MASELRVNTITSTTGVGTVTLGSGGVSFSGTPTFNDVTLSSINGNAISGTRNRIINGDFEIWQRGTSVTYLNGTTTFYLADRWSGAPEYQNARHQRVSVTSPIAGMTARYALRASSSTSAEAASGTRISLGQKIENLNCYDLAGKQVTLSFYVKFSSATSSASSGTYGNWQYYLAYDGTTTDASFYTTSPPTSTSSSYLSDGSLPTTWTKYTLTTTVPSGTNNISVRFQFDNLKNTSSADTTYYDITNIQLEVGPTATPFERRFIGQELALCQRYYQSIQKPIARGVAGGTNAFSRVGMLLPTTMRTAPSITVSGTIDWFDGSGVGTLTSSNVSVTYSTVNGIEFDFTVGNVTAQYRPIIIYTGGNTGSFVATAEL